MKRYELIKSILVKDRNTKRLIRLQKGSLYTDHERINTPFHQKILLCKRIEEVQKNKFNCFDCIVIPRNDIPIYFKEVEI